MSLFKNYLLAFYSQKLFRERRVVFVESSDKEKKLEAMFGLEESKTQADADISKEVKEIGWLTRRKAKDLSLITKGGTQQEAVAENVEFRLPDLLDDLGDYNAAMKKIERSFIEVDDPLLFQLMSGKTSDEIENLTTTIIPRGFNTPTGSSYQDYRSALSNKFTELMEIREQLGGQANAQSQIDKCIDSIRDELNIKREEDLKLLIEERQRVLGNIVSYIERKKRILEESLQELRDQCASPKDLKEFLDTGEEVGFFDYIREKTEIVEIAAKIKDGKVSRDEIEELGKVLNFQTEKIEDKKKSLKVMYGMK